MAHRHDLIACFSKTGDLICSRRGDRPKITLDVWLMLKAPSHVDKSVNLVWLPSLVREAVGSSLLHVAKQEVWAKLYELKEAGLLELRIESGFGARMKPADRALCPPVPGYPELLLSWARIP